MPDPTFTGDPQRVSRSETIAERQERLRSTLDSSLARCAALEIDCVSAEAGDDTFTIQVTFRDFRDFPERRPFPVEALQYEPHTNCGAVSRLAGMGDDFQCGGEQVGAPLPILINGQAALVQPGQWVVRENGHVAVYGDADFRAIFEEIGDSR